MRVLASGLLALSMLAGCGSGSDSKSAGGAKPAVKTHQPVKGADNLVGALAVGKTPAGPVKVLFELHSRPAAGQPVEVTLVIRSTSPAIERVSGTVIADEGLEIVEGAQIPVTDHLTEGSDVHHTVKLIPKQDGIYTFSAVVVAEALGRSTTTTFAMPLIASATGTAANGAGTPAKAAAPATAPAATAPATTSAPEPAPAPAAGAGSAPAPPADAAAKR